MVSRTGLPLEVVPTFWFSWLILVDLPLHRLLLLPLEILHRISHESLLLELMRLQHQDRVLLCVNMKHRRAIGLLPPCNDDRSVPSDLQSFSETLKSRLSALSTKYKESITKTTRGWKERLFARDIRTATVSRTLDHLEIAEAGRTSTSTPAHVSEVISAPDRTQKPCFGEIDT